MTKRRTEIELKVPIIKIPKRSKKEWFEIGSKETRNIVTFIAVGWVILVLVPLREPIINMFMNDPQLSGTLGWCSFVLLSISFLRRGE